MQERYNATVGLMKEESVRVGLCEPVYVCVFKFLSKSASVFCLYVPLVHTPH